MVDLCVASRCVSAGEDSIRRIENDDHANLRQRRPNQDQSSRLTPLKLPPVFLTAVN